MGPTPSGAPTATDAIRTTPRIHQRQTRRNTSMPTTAEHVHPNPYERQAASPVADVVRNAPPSVTPTMIAATNVPMPSIIHLGRKHGKNKRGLTRSRKRIAAIIDAQLQLDKDRNIHLVRLLNIIKLDGITFHAPSPKGSPARLPTISRDNNKDTLEPT